MSDASVGGKPPESVRTRLAFIGDVHGAWDREDELALKYLKADTAIFVGDFGEEDVELVTKVAQLDHPKLVMLGNHDAWSCLTSRRRVGKWRQTYNPGQADPAAKVRQQLEAIGDNNLAWNCKPVPNKPVAIVGGRPFSKGSCEWNLVRSFYTHMFGVSTLEESVKRTLAAAREVDSESAAVIVTHNGPQGLGATASAICGIDFREGAGDFGDSDLREALDELHATGRPVAVVAFGHMHDELRTGGQRSMIHLDAATGTLCVNAAVVPREKPGAFGARSQRHFCLVDFEGTSVSQVRHVWVDVDTAGPGQPCVLASEVNMLRRGSELETWDGHTSCWEGGQSVHRT